MRILGIETSCDETAAAVLEFREIKRRGDKEIKNVSVTLLSNVVHSQIAVHRKTGGVVPEVAAREHVAKIIPIIEEALGFRTPPDMIAVTYGPGLITSLMVGVETARTLSWAWKVPIVAVNHVEGHITAAFLEKQQKFQFPISNSQTEKAESYNLKPIVYPALALVVSGGHTELVLIKKPLYYQIIGATRDDAVGEAFDKVAKILGLSYPGGPIVSKLAENGDPARFPFNPPMLKSGDYDFSFSGIKTAVLYTVRDYMPSDSGQARMTDMRNDICASFQKAVVEVLVAKTIRATKEFGVQTIILAGGVAANKQLREQLGQQLERQTSNIEYRIPEPQYCTDNAVMIAIAGYFRAKNKEFTPWQKLDVDPNLVLGESV